MLKFKKASATNYLSIGEAEIDLDNRGLVLVEGINDSNETFQSNGAGKSTLLSMVTYALYGVTANGLKADDVINREAKKNMSVILEFEKDGVPYRIERYRKHKTYKNTTRFFQGEEELTADTVANTDKKILAVFGIDYVTYLNSIMYGQGDEEIFAKATDKGKKQILENLADISVYRYAQDIAKEKAKDALAQQEEFARQIQVKQQEIAIIKDSHERAMTSYEETTTRIKEETDKLAAWKKYVEEVTAQHEQFCVTKQVELDAVTADIEKAGQGSQVDPELTKQLNEASHNVTQLRTAKTTTDATLQTLQQTLNSLNTDTTCYVCGAPLDEEHRQQEIAKVTADITTQTDYATQLATAIEFYGAQLAEMQANYDQENTKVQNLNRNYQSLVNTKSQIEQEIQHSANAVTNAQNSMNTTASVLQTLQEVPVPTLDQERIDKTTEEITELETKEQKAKTDYSQFKVLVDEVFSNKGIRSEVLDLVTPFLNERANKYLGILTGSDIEIKFSTQTITKTKEVRDKFDLEVVNGSGGATYRSNSAGERKRIDLAISFAIQDLIQSKANIAVNIGLYDECFEGLDGIGCENVIKILKERQKEIGTIFVITHSEELKALFENVVTIQKVDGRATLVERTVK